MKGKLKERIILFSKYRDMENYRLLMDQSMQDSLKMERCTDTESTFGQATSIGMKDSINITIGMGKEHTTIPIRITRKEYGKVAILQVKFPSE